MLRMIFLYTCHSDQSEGLVFFVRTLKEQIISRWFRVRPPAVLQVEIPALSPVAPSMREGRGLSQGG